MKLELIEPIGSFFMPEQNITLMLGDCLELMKEIPDGSVDMVLTDPPYQITSCKWDKLIPFDLMWEQLKRIIKPKGAIVLFGSEPFSSALRMSNIKHYKYDWVWDKVNSGSGLLAKKQPLKQHELISVFSKNTHNYNPQMTIGKMRNKKSYGSKSDSVVGFIEKSKDNFNNLYYPKSIVTHSNASQKGKLHPTQKPVALSVRAFSNHIKLINILDLFGGSGSTLIGAEQTGRKSFLMELDEKYCDVIIKRWQDYTGKQAIHIDSGKTYDELAGDSNAAITD